MSEFNNEWQVEAFEHEQHIFYSVCGGIPYDEEEAWNEIIQEEFGDDC